MTDESSSQDTPLVLMTGIGKIFDAGEVDTHALAGIELSIRSGEFVAITGPSGCGKSTLLSILGLLDTASAGEYRLKGQDTAILNRPQRAEIRNREIGFIFQSFNLISDLTVEENVALTLTYRDGVSHRALRERARMALDRVGMSHRLRHYPAQLSGGQQQRVAVARALVGEPSLLLADEPTGNLDSDSGASVMELLEALHRSGSTICMVTHDPAFSARAGRTIRLRDGRLQGSMPNQNRVVDAATS
jgi:putative ABC transport system ATP-binding protein